ncbi:hypothetical protein BDF22DRAFT_691231 [Syncephalis plumigaleata]|nr:hypothetical protein BDF22DRAFT_691231 [Syncephalis plumigaleata]
MLRLHAILAVFGIIAATVQAEIVQINTPMGPFVPGGTATVTWTTDDKVQIEAVSRDSSSVLQVANASPNARNVVWKIPSDITGGTWFLRVNGASSPLFSGDFKVNGKNGSQPASNNNNNDKPADKKPDDKKIEDKKAPNNSNNSNSNNDKKQETNAKPSSDKKPATATGGAGSISITAASLTGLPILALLGSQLL